MLTLETSKHSEASLDIHKGEKHNLPIPNNKGKSLQACQHSQASKVNLTVILVVKSEDQSL